MNQGTATKPEYIRTDALEQAINAALTLSRPLLIKGEPGTGKTELALDVAQQANLRLYQWHIKSTTRAQQGLYEYDAVSRLRDSQLGDERVKDIANYIVKGVLWEAFESAEPAIVLIDEIDKADIEFPNDLLQEIDRMSFDVYETKQTIIAKHRPLVIITSNNEKELPDAFLRRCFFHYIEFPDRSTMERIVHAHELLDWLKLLVADDLTPEALGANDLRTVLPKMHGALLKNEQDVHLFERLVFLHRQRNRG